MTTLPSRWYHRPYIPPRALIIYKNKSRKQSWSTRERFNESLHMDRWSHQYLQKFIDISPRFYFDRRILPLRDIRWEFNFNLVYHFPFKWAKSKKNRRKQRGFCTHWNLSRSLVEYVDSAGDFPPKIICAGVSRQLVTSRFEKTRSFKVTFMEAKMNL